MIGRVVVAVGLSVGLLACAAPTAEICVVNERGTPLSGAWAAIDGLRFDADRDGVIRWRGDIPVMSVVTADEHIPEPVALGRSPSCMRVTLLERRGATVLHFGGDFMAGRRYLDPPDGEPLLSGDSTAEDARRLVESLSVGFALADVSVLNLKSVVGNFALDQAYPGKLWLIQTPPEALAALEELGVDAVVLANNHVADWQDEGVTATLDALRARGLPAVGAGLDDSAAAAPLILDAGGVLVGIIAFNSVDGEYVNDALPGDDAVAPSPIPDGEEWIWAARTWGEPSLGVPVASRRLGSAWRAFKLAERRASPAQAAALWRSARRVYPELQNAAARWGQGGAARWEPELSPARIRALAEIVDIVVVQLHMGMQFTDAPNSGLQKAAVASAEAGAHVVIGHHPHVLQGITWIDDTLVAWSLGNLMFDQDFYSTFDSGYLRVVFDGQIRQARFIPTFMDAYRPAPVTGPVAATIAGRVAQRSSVEAVSIRGPDREPVSVRTPPVGNVPSFTFEHGNLRIWRPGQIPTGRSLVQEVGVVALAPGTVARPTRLLPLDGVYLGEGLIRGGDMERHVADPYASGDGLWVTRSRFASIAARQSAAGERALQFVRGPDHESESAVRLAARIPIPRSPQVVDEVLADRYMPELEVEASVRVDGEADGLFVRLIAYRFSKFDPLRMPFSDILRTVEVPLVVEQAHRWQQVRVPVPPELLEPVDGVHPNFILPYIGMRPTSRRTSVAWVDDIQIIAWHPAADALDQFSRVDRVRGAENGVELEVLFAP